MAKHTVEDEDDLPESQDADAEAKAKSDDAVSNLPTPPEDPTAPQSDDAPSDEDVAAAKRAQAASTPAPEQPAAEAPAAEAPAADAKGALDAVSKLGGETISAGPVSDKNVLDTQVDPTDPNNGVLARYMRGEPTELTESQQMQFNIMSSEQKAALLSAPPDKQAEWAKTQIANVTRKAPPEELPPELQGDKGKTVTVPARQPVKTEPPAPPEGLLDPKKLQAASDQGQAAIGGLAKLDAATAKASAPLLQQTAKDQAANAQAMQAGTDATMADVQKRQATIEQLQAQKDAMLNDPKFGASHYWHSLDTSQQIMYGIGIALNTIVSAVTKGRIPNIAWDYFNGAIQRDTQAQFAKLDENQKNMQMQHNLATLSLSALGDRNTALAYVNFEKAQATAKQIEALAAQTGDQRVMLAAQKEAAEWVMKYQGQFIAAYQHNIAAQRAQVETQSAQIKNEQAQKRATITDSSGKPLGIAAPEVADKVHMQQIQAAQRIATINELLHKYPSVSATDLTAQDEIRSALRLAFKDNPEALKDMPNRLTGADLTTYLQQLAHDIHTSTDTAANAAVR